MIVVLAIRNHLAILFTDDDVLINSVSELARFLGITMLLSSVHPVISGVAVGCGWQGLVAYINLCSFYAFIFWSPVLYFILQGIWGGMLSGLALQTLLLLFLLFIIYWDKEIILMAYHLEPNAAGADAPIAVKLQSS